MSRMIGFDRKLELAWLDSVVALLQQGMESEAMLYELRQRLGSDITGRRVVATTATVLMRVWANVRPEHEGLRDEALSFAAHVTPGDRTALHWGMSLLAYPFFRDVSATVGNLGHLQGNFSLAQVRRRMVESWGERTTLQRAIQRAMRTLVQWGAVLDTQERGQYRLAPAQRIEEPSVALWLLHCALLANGSELVPLQGLGQLPYLFPFDLMPVVSDVRRSERFEVSRQGLDLEMVSVAADYTGIS